MSASSILATSRGVELSVVTGELGERRRVHESLYSRGGENAVLAQRLGQLALDLLIVLRVDGLGCAVPLDEPERADERSHVVARQALRGRRRDIAVSARQESDLRAA